MAQNFLIISFITILYITLQVSAKGFTESRTTDLLNGRVVKANERLVLVSVRPESINVTSLDDKFVPCRLNVEKDANVTLRLGDATSLGNGKIVVWNYVYNYGSTNRRWKIFVIDPVNCTSTTIRKVASEDDGTLDTINTVIPYHDSFDIFSRFKECSPCRFRDNGEQIDLPESTYKPLHLPDEYSISPIVGDNATSGYLLTENFDNCTSLVKILSPTFEVQKEQTLDRHVETASTDHGQIRICSSSSCLGQSNITHDCQVLDSNLRSEKSLERITENEDTFLELVQNLPDGGAVVAFVNHAQCFMGDGEGAGGDVYIRRIRSGGQVDSDLKFESVSCWEYDFQNFQMQGGRYCLVAYDGVNTGEHSQTVFIKCLKFDE